jgi:hypothetical protein
MFLEGTRVGTQKLAGVFFSPSDSWSVIYQWFNCMALGVSVCHLWVWGEAEWHGREGVVLASRCPGRENSQSILSSVWTA